MLNEEKQQIVIFKKSNIFMYLRNTIAHKHWVNVCVCVSQVRLPLQEERVTQQGPNRGPWSHWILGSGLLEG